MDGAIDAMLEFASLKQEEGWVKIEQGTTLLQDQRCLFLRDDGLYIVGHIDEQEGKWWIYEDLVSHEEFTWNLHDFVYYMPLPKKPKQ